MEDSRSDELLGIVVENLNSLIKCGKSEISQVWKFKLPKTVSHLWPSHNERKTSECLLYVAVCIMLGNVNESCSNCNPATNWEPSCEMHIMATYQNNIQSLAY